GTEFLNKTLNSFFKEEGIEHQTLTARTPEQNGVVKRRNRTLVEAARTMLLASQLPLFFWAEAIETTCYTQNRSIIIPTHDKTPYHIINDRKPWLHLLYNQRLQKSGQDKGKKGSMHTGGILYLVKGISEEYVILHTQATLEAMKGKMKCNNKETYKEKLTK
nr:retrovirus-related Pol polyprotein from transposon TNT 1-94 [Tanacetum cinerariifolium]